MVLVAETTLHLNPQHDSFDLVAVREVIGELNQYMLEENRQIDHLRLISVADQQVLKAR